MHSVLGKTSQSASLKLNERGVLTCSCGKRILVVIGKLSVAVRCSNGSTSHCINRLLMPSVQNKLSDLEHLFVTICWRVGISLGSTMSKLNIAMSSISPSAALVAC